MSNITGGCHCGAIRYQIEGDLIVHALCHCSDCRRHAGAPVVGWTMYAEDAFKVTKGQPKVYESSEHGRRHFCADCGTGLFYINANVLPGIIDIQSATYDDPNAALDGTRARIAQLRALSAADVAASRLLREKTTRQRPRRRWSCASTVPAEGKIFAPCADCARSLTSR